VMDSSEPYQTPSCAGDQDAEGALRGTCPDDGTCHHSCLGAGPCFRVLACSPLTAWGDQWPPEMVTQHRELDQDAEGAPLSGPLPDGWVRLPDGYAGPVHLEPLWDDPDYARREREWSAAAGDGWPHPDPPDGFATQGWDAHDIAAGYILGEPEPFHQMLARHERGRLTPLPLNFPEDGRD
jgi:hypothetical protein